MIQNHFLRIPAAALVIIVLGKHIDLRKGYGSCEQQKQEAHPALQVESIECFKRATTSSICISIRD
jgi:hypothetical protein